MALSAKQICILLRLPRFGREIVRSLCELSVSFETEGINLFECLFDQDDISHLDIDPAIIKTGLEKAIIETERIFEFSSNHGIEIIGYNDPEFPCILKRIPDPPVILNIKGNRDVLHYHKCIAIIGTRTPTPEGKEHGAFFGEYFARKGYNIVSGLARGCDTAAHEGAVRVNGMTTAFVPNGLHMTFPPENTALAERIIDNGGAIVSEYFYNTPLAPIHFIERDRLQAGLSMACICIQSDLDGGTMHAVRAIIKSNKPIAAIEYANNLLSNEVNANKYLIKKRKAFALTAENAPEFEKIVAHFISSQ